MLIVIDMKGLRENKQEAMTDEVTTEFKNPNVKVIYKKIKQELP